ncbi:6-pyruvoyl tetrahydrobiopterin synthase-like [Eupeodes corollae]|uniref:6-pyruvoyl tetrahydrobiopterin synthase-like n=1 Tax=Eupeodes corollae TaxID=290404 RepID=UPI0024918C9B|nr:6-pyruvoyl tetrahydrobiopterin synthase-like [Eupeodes corollae]XP_055905303.1 6-pyruvoyl tetrahydrobiopterin synthase-like [Eupeodes corollae]
MYTSIAFLTRRETFSACHRLNSQYLTAEENRETYGKCNNKNGHGHNYIVKVTVRGPIDPRTGMVMNINDLKGAMNAVITKTLDHKNLDIDVDYFEKIPSSMENISVYIWDKLSINLKNPELLYEIEIHETEKNSVVYRGPYLQNGAYTNGNGHRCRIISRNGNLTSESE